MRGRVVVGYYEYDLNLLLTENYVTIGGVIHQYDIIFIKGGIKIFFFLLWERKKKIFDLFYEF